MQSEVLLHTFKKYILLNISSEELKMSESENRHSPLKQIPLKFLASK